MEWAKKDGDHHSWDILFKAAQAEWLHKAGRNCGLDRQVYDNFSV